MNFFAHQDDARRRTRSLIFLFALAVISIVLLVNLVMVVVVANAGEQTAQPVLPGPAWLMDHLGLVALTTVGVLVLIAGASMFRIASLNDGGGAVARSMGGSLVPTDVADHDRRRLRNVVEEVALASGTPVPEIYVLEKEPGINAFAAGYTTSDAAVAVSRGCLEQLNREELQGVVAHEFSHILNGDMRINIRLIGVLFGILVIGLAGRHVLRAGHYGGRRNGAPLVFVGLALMVIGFTGLFFSRLIQASISRQRELLADASAVQFTRNPGGIAGALKKIAALSEGSQLTETDATEVSHMLFADGLGRKLFATHPPLDKRIRAIEPNFRSAELADIRARMAMGAAPAGRAAARGAPAAAAGFAGGAAHPGPPAPPAGETVTGAGLAEAVGRFSWDHVAYAEALMERLDPELLDAAHAMRGAIDLLLALLLSPHASERERQLALIAERLGDSHREGALALAPKVATLDPLHRLPLVELALPALKRRPENAIRGYIEVIERMIHSDGEISVFEFAIARLVNVILVESMNPRATARREQTLKLRELRGEIAVLLAVLAEVGHGSREEARRAFAAGWRHLFSMEPGEHQRPEDWVRAAGTALEKADGLEPLGKEALIEALVSTLAHDGRITLPELELLRAMCAALHCPMPPAIRAD